MTGNLERSAEIRAKKCESLLISKVIFSFANLREMVTIFSSNKGVDTEFAFDGGGRGAVDQA